MRNTRSEAAAPGLGERTRLDQSEIFRDDTAEEPAGGQARNGPMTPSQIGAELLEKAKMLEKRSCKGCVHFNVCLIWRPVLRQMSGEFGENIKEHPVEFTDLAKICKLYDRAVDVEVQG